MGVMMGAMIRIISRVRGMNEVLVTRDLELYYVEDSKPRYKSSRHVASRNHRQQYHMESKTTYMRRDQVYIRGREDTRNLQSIHHQTYSSSEIGRDIPDGKEEAKALENDNMLTDEEYGELGKELGTSFMEKKHATRRELFKPAALVVGEHHKKMNGASSDLTHEEVFTQGWRALGDMEGRGE
ncbi:hypothetical protein Bca4012_076162 [Brassica carinata]